MTRWLPAGPPETPPPAMAGRAQQRPPVLFLDRDGVLLVEKDYLSDPADVELTAGVPAALCRARERGFLLIGVSNQSGLGRGRFTPAQFQSVMARFDELLQAAGCPLDGFYYCPHAPHDGCACRKPAPGLLQEAAADWTWDPERAWVVGDKVSDVDLALHAGMRAVLVLTGHGAQQAPKLGERRGVLVVQDLPAAVERILAEASD
jgi:D-glycero-D-manno-heptose 1,7-bisphosphate phosphatase